MEVYFSYTAGLDNLLAVIKEANMIR